MHPLASELEQIFRRPAPPEPAVLESAARRAAEALAGEPAERRPPDAQGRPGGLVRLDPGLPTLIVPDLHARLDFLFSLLGRRPAGGRTVLERLAAGELQLLCLGDGMHAEARAAARWLKALREFSGGFRRHAAMDQEMRESLGLMQLVMELKAALPGRFHFLKGNHENIANEEGGGNHPFAKFALEGELVADYMLRFYGEEVLAAHYRFEKELPLLAAGRGFLASHAEPARAYTQEQVAGYRKDPEVVYGLTWTGNGQAEPGSVERMLEHYLGCPQTCYYFGGHRPVEGGYRLSGRYVQIHDPERWVVALLPAEGEIDLDRDIVEVEDIGEVEE